MVLAFAISRDGHAQRSGNRSRSVASSERVVIRFVTTQETADAAILLNRRQQIATPGQNLVSVSLMAHIPHQPVMGRVERIMQRDRKLNRAQRSASVTSD